MSVLLGDDDMIKRRDERVIGKEEAREKLINDAIGGNR